MNQQPAQRVMTCAPNEVVARGVAAMLSGSPAISVLGWAVPPWQPGVGAPGAATQGAITADFVAGALALAPEVVIAAGVGADSRWLRELVGQLVTARPTVRVLALVWAARPGWISDLAVAGAAGIADLQVTSEQLRSAILALAGGQDWVSPGVAAVLAREQLARDRGLGQEPLSTREWQVLGELARGGDNQNIAAELGISPNTVAIHVRAICAKLHASSRLEAVAIAIRTGLVEI